MFAFIFHQVISFENHRSFASVCIFFYISFHFIAPSKPPPNSQIEDMYSTTQLNISWSSLPPEFHNGDLSGYKFFYFMTSQSGVDVAGNQIKHLVQVDKFTHSYIINGLESYSEYEVHLYAFSRYGDGPPIVLKGGMYIYIYFLHIKTR